MVSTTGYHPARAGCGFPRQVLTLGALFAGKLARHVRRQRVASCDRRVHTTALLAFECTVFVAGKSRLELRQQHAILLTLRAAGALDGGSMGRGYRLIFRHDE